MKRKFSSLSTANCYKHMNDKSVMWLPDNFQEVYTNDYMSRSDIPDNISEKKHILFLGDSFVYGVGARKSDNISSMFEKELNDNDYCVVNLSVGGGSLSYALLRLQQWQNTFPNNIHSVYLGISGGSRSTYWKTESKALSTTKYKSILDANLYTDEIGIAPYTHIPAHDPELGHFDAARHILEGYEDEVTVYNALINLTTKIRNVSMIEQNLTYAKNIANANNFNVYTFFTMDDMLIEEEHDALKNHLEKNNSINFIYKKFDIIARSLKYRLEDGHWNSEGTKHVTNKLINETSGWY
jgi:hypothetical protein